MQCGWVRSPASRWTTMLNHHTVAAREGEIPSSLQPSLACVRKKNGLARKGHSRHEAEIYLRPHELRQLCIQLGVFLIFLLLIYSTIVRYLHNSIIDNNVYVLYNTLRAVKCK